MAAENDWRNEINKNFIPSHPITSHPPCLTCAVKGEEEEEQTGDQVPQESDHSAGDAFRDRVHRLDEELEEYRHAAVDENAHQDAGRVQDGCERRNSRATSYSFTLM